MKRLSVCMIVRDEETVIARCLDSVKDIADEIVIVDTGSKDKTKEIASRYTDLIYDFEWTNDFAAARNVSLSYASGKWILILDADEYLPSQQIEEWNDFLTNQVIEQNIAYTLLVLNLSDDEQASANTAPVTRLLPNYQGVFYSNPIHEQLTALNGKLYQRKVNLNICHTGYQTEAVISKNKHQRNMAIFEKLQASGVMNAYDYFTLGNQYVVNKEMPQAIQAYETSMSMVDKSKRSIWYPYCVMALIGLYMNQNQFEKSWELVENQLKSYWEYPEYQTMKGLHLEALGFKDEAILSYKEAIVKAEKLAKKQADFWLVNPDLGFEVPFNQLMNLAFQMEQYSDAIYWLTKLLQKNKKDTRHLIRLLEWLSQHENEAQIVEFLDKFYDTTQSSDATFLFKITVALGLLGPANHYYELISKNVELTQEDGLRLAVLNNDYEGWKQHINQGIDDIFWLQVALGSLIWNVKIELLGKEYEELSSILFNIIEDQPIDESKLNTLTKDLFLIAKNLFIQRRYELFDTFVTKVSHPELINMLANYFYKLSLTDLALKYYSVLLQQEQLDLLSYENLGLYHANHHYTGEAVEFLNEVLNQDPNKKHLYYTVMNNMTDIEQRKQFVEAFSQRFPELLSISFIKKKLKEI